MNKVLPFLQSRRVSSISSNPVNAQHQCDLKAFELPVQTTVTSTVPPVYMFFHDPAFDNFISESLRTVGHWEKWHLDEFLADLETLGGVGNAIFMDIGANIGAHTLPIAAAGYEVHAFEPIPSNFRLLQCSAASNEMPHLHINNIALSDSKGPDLCMMSDKGNRGHSYVADPHQKDFSTDASCTFVKVTTLDDYWMSIMSKKRPTVMKIDVEGFEYKVLSGGKQLFTQAPPLILETEFSPQFLFPQNTDPIKYLELIRSYCYWIHWDGKIQPLTDSVISDVMKSVMPNGLKDLTFHHKSC